ncbi:hypothetical protein BCY86_00415 [Pajaroellobacter abortibovis]|uniref:Uncharacterized protein n=1 Tax=Pajaroellobacter abortibovis TaxID=1882918 RepID=A0A1L6MUZ1_9BACT|nr:hypothetical protein BCY86_00415 [Pajaroellobacter abortibovis]
MFNKEINSVEERECYSTTKEFITYSLKTMNKKSLFFYLQTVSEEIDLGVFFDVWTNLGLVRAWAEKVQREFLLISFATSRD